MIGRAPLALAALAALALLATAAFLALNLRGDIGFALELRGARLLALVCVGVSIATSTIVFQTVTGNRILTPSVMGLDALYGFVQIGLVFALGGLGFATLDPRMKFAGETALMTAMALALFLPMLRARLDMTLMLLSGVVLGVLLRSLSSLLARVIDPNDFAIASGASFASFNAVRGDLLAVASLMTIAACVVVWRARHVLDVLALGQDASTALGVDWRRTVAGLLALVAALVAVSTALVGPMVFVGLLVVALAERVVNTRRHAVLLPAAALTAIVVLVGGQATLQHGLGGASALAIVVEFAGGLLFLALLFAESRRR
ncbi:iron chelate uptake ABC transporter family permease subunit [Methylopila turkensis]|uniref:Enterobactin ABC transporter permease n=1 Tax=Methylopila turkensis TaxID=1437816 RepID=A0A9W6JR95_9HYPH|nr:iron chelate uptake ABC transporter family permease subunit [Methylopila turkensis]GLK80329.1 enterobactin ABC transporter permease [Methylopila turkensis]